jgi:hypothetical protein
MDCVHSWVAGMMYVDDEDLEFVAQRRRIECEKCEKVYDREEIAIQRANDAAHMIAGDTA